MQINVYVLDCVSVISVYAQFLKINLTFKEANITCLDSEQYVY